MQISPSEAAVINQEALLAAMTAQDGVHLPGPRRLENRRRFVSKGLSLSEAETLSTPVKRPLRNL
jgi:hypothetical protein